MSHFQASLPPHGSVKTFVRRLQRVLGPNLTRRVGPRKLLILILVIIALLMVGQLGYLISQLQKDHEVFLDNPRLIRQHNIHANPLQDEPNVSTSPVHHDKPHRDSNHNGIHQQTKLQQWPPASQHALVKKKSTSKTKEIQQSSLNSHRKSVVLPEGLKWLDYTEYNIHHGMSDEAKERLFHRFVEQSHLECSQHHVYGSGEYGGWPVCLVGPYTPQDPCLVYSFGINYDWSFDDQISQIHGCTVRSFDPSMDTEDHQRSSHVMFYHVGLGGQDGLNFAQMSVKTFSTLLEQMKEQNATIDYLKLDIEYDEWVSLVTMLSDHSLNRVKQLGFEIHTGRAGGLVPTLGEDYVHFWTILSRLEQVGFVKWKAHMNRWGLERSAGSGHGVPYTSCCYEMVYVNLNFLSSGSVHRQKTSKVSKALKSHFNESQVQLEDKFIRMLKHVDGTCAEHFLQGHVDDGGWDVCLSPPLVTPSGCLVYVLETMDKGELHALADVMDKLFDCQSRIFSLRNSSDTTHLMEIHGQHRDRTLTNKQFYFSEIVEFYNKGRKTVDVLKMDLGRDQWDVMATMLDRNEFSLIKQFILQINLTDIFQSSQPFDVIQRYINVLTRLRKSGFSMWRYYFDQGEHITSPLTGKNRKSKVILNFVNSKVFS